jgi:hypothetical protein
MATVKQKLAAEKFAKDWEGKGYERGQSQTFWLSLLNKVLVSKSLTSSFLLKIRLVSVTRVLLMQESPLQKLLLSRKALEKIYASRFVNQTVRC